MLTYFAIFTFIIWILATSLKYTTMQKNRTFSYRDMFFSKQVWYNSPRTILLIFSLFLLDIFAPIRVTFILIIISSFLCLFISLKNFFNFVAKPKASLFIAFFSLILIIIMIIILSKF